MPTTLEEHMRQMIFDLEDWRDELATARNMLQMPDLTREQRLTLQGDEAVLLARIHRAETDISLYKSYGMAPLSFKR